MKKQTSIPNVLYSSGAQMTTLASAHFMADMMGGLLPGFLPVALNYFHLDLGMGVFILTSMSIGCNMMQIPVAYLDRGTRNPRLISIGLLMAGLILLLGALPATTPVIILCLIMLTVGAGVAIVHPTGLRGIQNIGKIAPTVSTPAFMTGGFLGACIGPWLSATLVSHCGLKGLFFLIPVILLLLAALRISHVRLALDRPNAGSAKASDTCFVPWNFRSLLLISFFMNTGTTTIQMLLPTQLNTLGFSLSFGGFSAMLFGIGSAAGSICIGMLVKKYPAQRFIFGGLLLGVPVIFCYFMILQNVVSCLLILIGGFTASSCYPLLVALSRNAPNGPGLGSRMALIVGGTWGLAGIFFLGIGQFAARAGIGTAMHTAWFFYLLALIAAVTTLRREKPDSKKQPASDQPPQAQSTENRGKPGEILKKQI